VWSKVLPRVNPTHRYVPHFHRHIAFSHLAEIECYGGYHVLGPLVGAEDVDQSEARAALAHELETCESRWAWAPGRGWNEAPLEAKDWWFVTWDLGLATWDMGLGIWDMGYGHMTCNMGSGIRDMGYGIWDMGCG
jgi:hypothetical protein